MGKINEYLDKIIESDDQEKMDELSNIFVDMFEYIKNNNKDMKDDVCDRMYELAYGKVLTKEMADKWVENMNPKGKWTIDETTQAMRTLGYDLGEVPFYVVANMIYSDNYNELANNDQMVFRLAKNWLEDEDVSDDKLFNYWKYVIKD